MMTDNNRISDTGKVKINSFNLYKIVELDKVLSMSY